MHTAEREGDTCRGGGERGREGEGRGGEDKEKQGGRVRKREKERGRGMEGTTLIVMRENEVWGRQDRWQENQ